MKRDAWTSLAGAGIVLVLAAFWVRENEARVAAENRLKDLSFKAESHSSRQANLVTELKAEISGLEAGLADATRRFDEELAAKDVEITRLREETERLERDLENAVRLRESRVAELQKAERVLRESQDKAINEKNAELAALGVQLKDASAKVSELLSDKARLESRLLECLRNLAATAPPPPEPPAPDATQN